MNEIIVGLVEPDAFNGVLELYRTGGYGGGVAPGDRVIGAWSEARLVGVVRLCDEAGVIVLRGMQIASDFRRQGIGRTMLAYCVPYLERATAYCLPYEHLTDFYGAIGFAPAAPEALPAFLAQRLAGYQGAGQRTLAMYRAPVGHSKVT